MSNSTTALAEAPAPERADDQNAEHTDRLNAGDRCDHCGHRAWVEATLPFGVLTFCAHHYTQHEAKLAHLGAKVHDERHRLLERPLPVQAAPEAKK